MIQTGGKTARLALNAGARRYAHKEVKFSNDARAAMLRGVEMLAKAVSVTLGPKGRNVIIEQSFGGPKITKDGVTVAKAITLQDKFENMGARLIQEVASKTNEIAGDGTTTSTVLSRAIFSEGVKNVSAGCSPIAVRRGAQKAIEQVLIALDKGKRNIESSEGISQVATISANGDAEVGDRIAQAMQKVGKEGVITVKEGKTLLDEIEVTEGMKFDRGFISPYFMTDAKSQKVLMEKPLILLSENKISQLADILPAMEAAAGARRPLLIIAEDIDGEALAACILNKLRGQLAVAAVKAPGFGDNRKSILGDLGILTGSTVFKDEGDIKLDKATIEQLGGAGSVVITKDDTTVMKGDGLKSDINIRCELIRDIIADPKTGDYDRTKLQERLAKLSGGVAVIMVGGASEVEVGERKDRFDDALNATRAAVSGGIVAGGGLALFRAAKTLKDFDCRNFDENVGVGIIRYALEQPLRTIVDNAGKEGSVVVGKLLDQYKDEENTGYDAANDVYVDMFKAGIIDPLLVTRQALTDAGSVATLLFTAEAAIVEAPEDKQPSPSMGGGGMGGGMGGMGGMF